MGERQARQPRRCGARRRAAGTRTWRVWAPKARAVELILRGPKDGSLSLQSEAGGYFSRTEADVPDGQRYAFRLDGGPERPDPCSLWQPDVHGLSVVYSPERFDWHDG